MAEPERLGSLDDLKVALVTAIIAGHAVIGYATVGSWLYQDVQEATITPAAETLFAFVPVPPALFAMGLFFLIAGLLTPGSLDCKGPRRFVRDRLLRLGLPWASFALVLWPLLMFAMYRAIGAPVRRPFGPISPSRCWTLGRCGSWWSCCCTPSATPPGGSCAQATAGRPTDLARPPAPGRRGRCVAATLWP